VEMVAQRLTNSEIAKQMFVSTGTVKSYMNRVFPKLGMQSRGQLATLVASRTGVAAAGAEAPRADPGAPW